MKWSNKKTIKSFRDFQKIVNMKDKVKLTVFWLKQLHVNLWKLLNTFSKIQNKLKVITIFNIDKLIYTFP